MKYVLSFLLMTILGGCASKSLESKPPNIEKAEWIEVRTSHFQIQTDLPEAQARELATEMHRRALAVNWALLQQETLPPFQSRIIVFRHDRDFEFFAPKLAGAFATTGLPAEIGLRATIVQKGIGSQTSFSIFQHELTHRLMFEAFDNTPPWLAEGMATYYGALSLHDGHIRLGEQPVKWVFAHHGEWKSHNRNSHIEIEVPISQLVPPHRLMEMKESAFFPRDVSENQKGAVLAQIESHYASSWAFVNLLLNGPEFYRQKFAQVLAHVAEGRPTTQALELYLHTLPAQKVERDFYAHVQAQQRNVWQTNFPNFSDVPSIDSRPMSKTEVSVLWIKLALKNGKTKAAEAWLSEANARDPHHPQMLVLAAIFDLANRKFAEGRHKLEQAHTKAPQDGEALAGLVGLYLEAPEVEPDPQKREQLLKHWTDRLAKIASEAFELQVAAKGLAATGRMDEAEVLAKQAIRSNQGCYDCFETMATIRFAQGDTDGAVALQRIALSRATENASDATLKRLAARLQEYRSSSSSAP